MFKFVVLALIGCALAAPAPEPKPGYLASPLIASPSVAVAPVATSYANTYKVSYNAPAAVAYTASAPLAYAAPAYHAPLVAHGYHHAVAAPALAYTAHAAPVVALH